MMRRYLILQVLGSSDILVDSESGTKKLEACYTLADVQEAQQWNDQEFIDELERVDFPLIRQVWQEQKNQAELYWGVILTNQVDWMQHQDESGEAWNDIVTSDGYWWRNILENWCQQQGINYCPIFLDIGADIPKGAADWEGMAKQIDPLLNGLIQFESSRIVFCPKPGQTIPVDQILVQHSSGTPALSSALYLWGIEQKLAKREIEFIYISRQKSISYFHSGTHWQWRLKVPQIRQLLAIQDFAGANELLADHPDQTLRETCQYLDRAVSFNLAQLNLGLTPQAEVIERISIALWSEQAFRDRGQWMHWYLRVAGAFELAIAYLIIKRGSGNYRWNKADGKTFLEYTDPNTGNTDTFNHTIGIKKRVTDLLSHGSTSRNCVRYQVTAIQSNPDWHKFKDFYCDKKWQLDAQTQNSFIYLRNDLYHALLGDSIDKILDARKEVLGSVNHPDHPSEVAVQQLRYIIELAGLSSQVQQRVQVYESKVNDIKRGLDKVQDHRELV
ncbi:MAG: hypothetical protein RIG63_07685 [Coleofasciculus chthonoplastes F3-SA18-01]